jgi:hypothetical protein
MSEIVTCPGASRPCGAILTESDSGSFSCPKCMCWFPPDSGWLGRSRVCIGCKASGRRLDSMGMCYACVRRWNKEARERREASERAQREARRRARAGDTETAA